MQYLGSKKLPDIEQSLLLRIIEDSADYIGMADMDGNLLYHNRSAKKMVGLPEDCDMSGKNIKDMHPQWAVNKILDEGVPTLFKYGVWHGETALLHQENGNEIPVMQTLTLNRDADGHPSCMTTIMCNVTEYKESEFSAKESKERLSIILDTAPNGILSIDGSGMILSANKALTKIFGYLEEELIGNNINMLVPKAYYHQHTKDVSEYSKNGGVKQMALGREVKGIRKDGTEVYLEVGLARAMLPNNSVQVVATVQDITWRKQQEEYRQKLVDQLLNSNTELERFAYIASHDMQEPIRMVTNFSAIIANDYSNRLDDTGKEYLKLVVDSGIRMKDLVEDLLSYSRLGNEESTHIKFDGEHILSGVLDNLKELIKESKAVITHDKLPELNGNPIQIMRLLQNLITNAIKYQPKGNTPDIKIGVEEKENEWCVFVQDNGIGVKPEFADQIFQPFRRLHTWEKIKGTGLGLSICKKIVENHGGKIWISSKANEGSTFFFTVEKDCKSKNKQEKSESEAA